jgi:hypothetical protein
VAFPAARGTADEVNAVKRGKQKIGEIAAILPTQISKVPNAIGVDDLALLDVDPEYAKDTGRTEQDVAQARKAYKQIVIVREPIRQALLRRQLVVASDVLDALVFDAARDGSPNIAFDVIKRIRDARSLRPGILIFPVHSLGVLAAGLLQPARARISFLDPEAGLAISPQTNSMKRTLEFLEDARVYLDVKQELPIDLLEHWRRSRPTKWLERNPLLVVRARQIPGGSFYTNEGLLLSRLQAATGQIALLAALQPPNHARAGTLFSTRIINNWETLDIHHYLALFDTGGQRKLLHGDCVPIHASRTGVTDLTELALEIDPKYWMRYSKEHAAIRASVDEVYAGYFRRLTGTTIDNVPSRTYHRLFTALTYFRRSYRGSANDFTAVVTLSTAFELMLTDSSRGVGPAMRNNAAVLLKGKRGVKGMTEAVGDLYQARCDLVHAGKPASPNLHLARRAFALCFIGLAGRIKRIAPRTSTPVTDMMASL